MKIIYVIIMLFNIFINSFSIIIINMYPQSAIYTYISLILMVTSIIFIGYRNAKIITLIQICIMLFQVLTHGANLIEATPLGWVLIILYSILIYAIAKIEMGIRERHIMGRRSHRERLSL